MPAVESLPLALRGPVDVEFAKAREDVPARTVLPGGCVYELKWDGFRLVVVRNAGRTTLWSRQGKDLTDRFPDIAAAAARQVPDGTVLDGEVVVWHDGRLDFDLLQRRLVTSPAKATALVAAHPASFVAFDVLARHYVDQRPKTLTDRRVNLEVLAQRWRSPLELSPTTTDVEVARGWMEDYRAAGIEGLVVKGAASTYAGGRREWLKVKSRETREVIVLGVTGTLEHPVALIVGLYRGAELVTVGQSTALNPRQADDVASALRPAPAGTTAPTRVRAWGPSTETPVLPVTPFVVEITADSSLQAGRFRHAVRYVRRRQDLTPGDVETLDAGAA